MRGFLIFVWCVVTAMMFYSAWRFKAPEIQADIAARVTQEVHGAGGENVAIEVDGRHVNLRGYASSETQKTAFLDTADNTYGALGPVDGLVLPQGATRTFLSAARTADGVVISGVVGTEAEKESLITQAKTAGLANVTDDITVASGAINWSDDAQMGFAQLADLNGGHLYISDDRQTLSGDAPTTEIASAANEMGDTWQTFVAGPALEDPRIAQLSNTITEREAQAADLEAQLNAQTSKVTALNGEIDTLKTGIAAAQSNAETLQGQLDQSAAELAEANAATAQRDTQLSEAAQTVQTRDTRIVELEAELANKATMTGNMEAEMAQMTTTLALLRDSGGEETSNLEAALAEQTALASELESELVALNAAKDEKINALDGQVATLSADNADLLETLTGRTTELANLNQLYDTDTAAKDAQIAALEADLSTKLAEQATALDTAVAQTASLTQEVGTLKSQLSDFEATRTKLGALETTVTEKDAKIAALMSDLENQPTMVEPQTTAQCNQTAQGLLANGNINFVSNSADMLEESLPLLERITGVVLACSGNEATVTVAGHTDSLGGDAANQQLSEARAQSVAQYMIARGVDAKALQPVGFGETQPIANNDTTEGRAANRRISFEFQAR